MRVRFLVSSNCPGSVARITTDTANALVRMGIPTLIEFPAVDWWDYKRFSLERASGLVKYKELLKLGGEAAAGWLIRKSWTGSQYHAMDKRVATQRYGVSPSAAHWQEDEITVVHPPYLMSHLLRTIPHPNVKLVSALHMNLEKAVNSPSPQAVAWYRHWVARERLISIPRYTSSQQAREAAQRLGISVRRVIPDGIDLSVFHPLPFRPVGRSLVVTLYCMPHPQKGQIFGLQALTALKQEAPDVKIASVGKILSGYGPLFDRQHGFLRGAEYAQVLRESDIVIYPSLYDGFPAPPLQAMASGTALVTTTVEGVEDYAVSGENCLLVKPADAQALREEVLRLVQDHSLRRRLQENGPKTAQRFHIERITKELLAFLQEVYEEPAAAPHPAHLLAPLAQEAS